MRLVFAGTPEFAARSLARLIRAGHEIPLVLTQPDRPSGRGLQAVPGAVKRLALENALDIYQPVHLRSEDAVHTLAAARPDALVVAAYGAILPQAVLDIPRLGAWNIHASLLPRWRGAAPIQRALLAGDAETGISIMRMEAGLDTGPVLSTRRVPILPSDDAGTLHDRLAEAGAEAIAEALDEIASGGAQPVAQPLAGVTYAQKINKREAHLDWNRPAADLERAVRAFRPTPGATMVLQGVPLKVWRARAGGGTGVPGTVLKAAGTLDVACGDGVLQIEEVQRPGGKPLRTAEFLRGREIAVGERAG